MANKDDYEKSDNIVGIYEKVVDGYHLFSSLTNGIGNIFFGKKFYLKSDFKFKAKNIYQLKFKSPQILNIMGNSNSPSKVINWTEKGFKKA